MTAGCGHGSGHRGASRRNALMTKQLSRIGSSCPIAHSRSSHGAKVSISMTKITSVGATAKSKFRAPPMFHARSCSISTTVMPVSGTEVAAQCANLGRTPENCSLRLQRCARRLAPLGPRRVTRRRLSRSGCGQELRQEICSSGANGAPSGARRNSRCTRW